MLKELLWVRKIQHCLVENMKKKVLILGASSDIGIETTKLFLKKGWEVIAHYNFNSSRLKKLSQDKKNKISLIKINFLEISKAQKIIFKNKKLLQNVSSFVSLTGYLKSDKVKEFNLNSILEHIKVNFFSNLLLINALKKQMIDNKFGRILLSSSIGTKFGGSETTYAYSVSKFLNEFIPNQFQKKFADRIIYNTIQIGVTDTKIHNNIKNKNFKKRKSLIPTKRIAKPSEVANKIFFLASDENTLIHGQLVNISGGE